MRSLIFKDLAVLPTKSVSTSKIHIEPEDIEESFPDLDVKLPNEFMKELAERMRDYYLDWSFREHLEMIPEDMLERKYGISVQKSQEDDEFLI
jgi:hypothetical protein